MASSQRDTESARLLEEVGEILENAQNNLPNFKTAIANKHVVIFLGNTRSGKSTLVNYIVGTKLIAFEERNPIFKIKKANEQASGPKIGQGSQSCTSIPGIYPLNDLGMVVIDAPGFDDNRNEGQDIVNALYVNQIKHAKTVKFVLVSDINDLTVDNVKGFTDLVEKVYALFPDFESMKNSVSIVFTKDFRNYTQLDISELLRRKIINVDGLHLNKQLIEHFVENNELIGLFRMPVGSGNVGSEIDVNIEGSRLISCALLLNEGNIKTALSSKSRLALLRIYQNCLDSTYFEDELKVVLIKFNDYYKLTDYVFASTNGELRDVKHTLKHVQNLFRSEVEKPFHDFSDIIGSLRRILFINMSHKFSSTIRVLGMIDKNCLMEDQIKERFINKYRWSLNHVLKKIESLTSQIDEELDDRKKDRDLFNASAGVTGVAGGAAVAGEVLHRVLDTGTRFASFGLLGIISGIVTGIGAGLAVTSLVVQKKTERKRMEARQNQGRRVYDGVFDDDH